MRGIPITKTISQYILKTEIFEKYNFLFKSDDTILWKSFNLRLSQPSLLVRVFSLVYSIVLLRLACTHSSNSTYLKFQPHLLNSLLSRRRPFPLNVFVSFFLVHTSTWFNHFLWHSTSNWLTNWHLSNRRSLKMEKV